MVRRNLYQIFLQKFLFWFAFRNLWNTHLKAGFPFKITILIYNRHLVFKNQVSNTDIIFYPLFIHTYRFGWVWKGNYIINYDRYNILYYTIKYWWAMANNIFSFSVDKELVEHSYFGVREILFFSQGKNYHLIYYY